MRALSVLAVSNTSTAKMLPDTPHEDSLKQEVVPLRPEVKVIKEQFEQLMQHNHKLQLEVDAMARKFFGEGSEKLNPAQ
jgi:regulator of replication initiation timing